MEVSNNIKLINYFLEENINGFDIFTKGNIPMTEQVRLFNIISFSKRYHSEFILINESHTSIVEHMKSKFITDFFRENVESKNVQKSVLHLYGKFYIDSYFNQQERFLLIVKDELFDKIIEYLAMTLLDSISE